MNYSARWLSMSSLLFLLISGFSARAEDQPMARAVLPPPPPASPPAAQSVPSAAAAPEQQRVAKPAAGERVPTEDRKHQAVHHAGISSGKLKREAAADRHASSSLKKKPIGPGTGNCNPIRQNKSSRASGWRAPCPFPAHRRRSSDTIPVTRRGSFRMPLRTNTPGYRVPRCRGKAPISHDLAPQAPGEG